MQYTIKKFSESRSQKIRQDGRETCNNETADRKDIRKCVRDHKKTSSETSSAFSEYIGQNLSGRTARRTLAEDELKECTAKRKPLLSVKNNNNRLM